MKTRSVYQAWKHQFTPTQWKRLMEDFRFAVAVEERRMGLASDIAKEHFLFGRDGVPIK